MDKPVGGQGEGLEIECAMPAFHVGMEDDMHLVRMAIVGISTLQSQRARSVSHCKDNGNEQHPQ